MFAVGEVVRDVEAPFGADRHELECFHPACDDLSDTEFGWFAALNRAVEDCSVDESAVVVDADAVLGGWFLSDSRCKNLILKAAWHYSDLIALSVLFEEFLSRLADRFVCFFSILLKFCEIVAEELLSLSEVYFRLFAFAHCFDAFCERFVIQAFDVALGELLAKA